MDIAPTPAGAPSWFARARHSPAIHYVLVVASILLVYANALPAGFVYDDPVFLAVARDTNNVAGIGQFFKKPVRVDPSIAPVETLVYRPVVFAYWAIGYRLWGTRPWAWHLINVVLHAGTACLVLLTFRRLYGLSQGLATVACLFWAVHPIHVESVTYVTGANYLLPGLFLMVAVLLACGSWPRRWPQTARALLAVGAFGVSVLSHELGLMAPVLVVLALAIAPTCGFVWGHRSVPGVRATAIAMGAAAGVYLVARLTLIDTGEAGHLREVVATMGPRLLQAPEIIIRYLGLLAVPARLTLDRSQDLPTPASVLDVQVLLAWGLCASLLWGLTRVARRLPQAVFGCGWFLIAYLPISNTILPLYSVMAERYMYIASVGMLAAAAAVTRASGIPRRYPRATALVIVSLMAGYAARSIARNRDFRDDLTFYLATVETSPKSSHMRNNLGNAYLDRGQIDKAEQEYRAAAGLNPANAHPHFNLGVVAMQRGLLDEAETFYRRATSVRPDYAPTYYNLGVVAYRRGKALEAIWWFERAATLQPGRAETRLALGKAYLSVNPERAAQHLRRFLEIAPEDPEATAVRAHLSTLSPALRQSISGLAEGSRGP